MNDKRADALTRMVCLDEEIEAQHPGYMTGHTRAAEIVVEQRSPIGHVLKCWPEQFAAIRDRRKRFEVRKADRDFRVGDYLSLWEWLPDRELYTGNVELCVVDYLLEGGQFELPQGVCVMSISPAYHTSGTEGPLPSPTDTASGDDEMIRQLERLRDKAPGYGMSFMRRGPGGASGAELSLYGPRAEAAMWLIDNADKVIAALASTPQPASAETDARLLDVLRDESWDLRCFNIPTGGGDADIGWRVIGHWMAEPCERVMGEVFHDDPRAAIRAAIRQSAKGGE
ncbi:DUF3850 domain-containing protein [Rhizorhabdus histidinilytica]|uniref:DUF3850 domain-containing protein n=1 Tax=Rhizorhabdus histidinilytica TaxID=439228 RepID=UPI00321F9752